MSVNKVFKSWNKEKGSGIADDWFLAFRDAIPDCIQVAKWMIYIKFKAGKVCKGGNDNGLETARMRKHDIYFIATPIVQGVWEENSHATWEGLRRNSIFKGKPI